MIKIKIINLLSYVVTLISGISLALLDKDIPIITEFTKKYFFYIAFICLISGICYLKTIELINRDHIKV